MGGGRVVFDPGIGLVGRWSCSVGSVARVCWMEVV